MSAILQNKHDNITTKITLCKTIAIPDMNTSSKRRKQSGYNRNGCLCRIIRVIRRDRIRSENVRLKQCQFLTSGDNRLSDLRTPQYCQIVFPKQKCYRDIKDTEPVVTQMDLRNLSFVHRT